MTAAVIAHSRADIFGNSVEVADQVLDRLLFQLRLARDRLVYVRNVGVVMFAVMNLHGLRIDIRFERVLGIWKRR